MSSDKQILQFEARKVVLDAADRERATIRTQGELSLAETQLIPELLRAKRK